MGLELSNEVAKMINDLFKINVRRIESFEEIKEINYLKFDYDKWKKEFYMKIEKYEKEKLLSKEEINKAKMIFNKSYKSTYIFNNGDFYPRNFIKLKNKVVLIDWDDWDGSYRANIIDYWENVVAFCFIHMWSNHFWQLNFLKSIQKKFKINPNNLQKALLIKSFEQADFWFQKGDKFEAQLFIFKNALDIEYIDYLINYTKPAMIYRFLLLLKRK